MRRLRNPVAVIMAIMMVSFIFGCVEEAVDDGGNEGNGGNGDQENDAGGGGVVPPMDVEVTNMYHQWTPHPEKPLAQPDLKVTCDAINYGGEGYADIVVFVNGTNSTMDLRRRILLKENQQAPLEFRVKFPCRPTEVLGRCEKEKLSVLQPKADNVDAAIANLYYDLYRWTREDSPQIEGEIFLSAVNYGLAGHVTLVVEVNCGNQTKKVEERVHLDTNQQRDLKLPVTLAGFPDNLTAYTRRPQADE